MKSIDKYVDDIEDILPLSKLRRLQIWRILYQFKQDTVDNVFEIINKRVDEDIDNNKNAQ